MSGHTHEIVRTARGKSEVVESGPLPKMRDRLKQLRAATRGGRVSGRGGKKYSVSYELREKKP
jgi:hypothetical protein